MDATSNEIYNSKTLLECRIFMVTNLNLELRHPLAKTVEPFLFCS